MRVPAGLPKLLQNLDQALGGAVALVSGRTLEDLDRLFGPLPLALVGQHGAEIRFPDGTLETAGPGTGRLDHLLPAIEAFVLARPGLLVENKGRTVAVHCRLVPELEDELGDFLRQLVANENPPVTLLAGRRVFELKPQGIGKGLAIARLLENVPFRNRVPVFIGDDTTDEEGFAVVDARGGHAIRVGQQRGSAARLTIADPSRVRAYLATTLEHLTASSVQVSHADA